MGAFSAEEPLGVAEGARAAVAESIGILNPDLFFEYLKHIGAFSTTPPTRPIDEDFHDNHFHKKVIISLAVFCEIFITCQTMPRVSSRFHVFAPTPETKRSVFFPFRRME